MDIAEVEAPILMQKSRSKELATQLRADLMRKGIVISTCRVKDVVIRRPQEVEAVKAASGMSQNLFHSNNNLQGSKAASISPLLIYSLVILAVLAWNNRNLLSPNVEVVLQNNHTNQHGQQQFLQEQQALHPHPHPQDQQDQQHQQHYHQGLPHPSIHNQNQNMAGFNSYGQ